MASVGVDVNRGILKHDVLLPQESGRRPRVLFKGAGGDLVARAEGVQEVFDILGVLTCSSARSPPFEPESTNRALAQ